MRSAQISLSLSGGFWPTTLPLFQVLFWCAHSLTFLILLPSTGVGYKHGYCFIIGRLLCPPLIDATVWSLIAQVLTMVDKLKAVN